MQKLTLKQRKALILMLLLLWLLLLVQGCCSLYSFFSRYRLSSQRQYGRPCPPVQ